MANNRDTFTTEIYVNNEQANESIAEMTKQLTKLTDKYNDLAARNEKLKEKADKAKAAMEETAKALSKMTEGTEEYAKTSKQLEKQTKAYNDLARQVEVSNRKVAAAEKEMKSMEESLKRAEKGTDAYRKALEELSGKSMNSLLRMQSQLKSELDKTKPNTKEWKELADQYAKVTNRIKGLEAAQISMVQRQGNFFQRMAKGLSDYYGAITLTIGAIRRGIAVFSNTYKTISNFEQANANLSTILGVTRDQMERLEMSAMKLGSTTRYTATQVTELQTELAKLGFTQQEILDMAPAVLNFATAMGTDLASAASMAGVALRSFELQSDQTEDVLGTMAVACNKSALSFDYLQSAFSTIGPVAKSYGLSLKDTIALLGTLANAGFDASSAATATRNILLKMVDANGDLAKSLGGSVKTFDDIMNGMIKLRDSGLDLAGAFELTDQRSVSAFSTFLRGAESAKELRASIEDVNGALTATAEVRADTVQGAVAGLQSAWEGFILSFRNSSGTVKEMINTLTNFVRKLPQYSDSIAKVTKYVLGAVLAIKAFTAAQTALNVVQKLGNTLRATGNTIIWAARTAFFRLIGATEAATIAQAQLNAVMSASVFGVIALAVGGLTAAITHLVKKQREAKETTDYLAEAEKQANEEYGEQAGKVKALTSIVENNNIALSERKKALEELNRIVPGYHGDLTEEGRLIKSNKEAIDEYCKSLRERIRLEARKDQLVKIETQIAALEDQKADAQERQHQALVDSGGDTTEKDWGKHSWFTGKLEYTPYGQAKADEAAADKQIADLTAQAEKVADGIGKIFTDPIEKIKAEYEAMFEQIRKESLDDPKAGEVEIRRLQEERDRKISEIRKTNAEVTKVETEGIAQSNTILTQTQFEYLQQRQDKLTKKEKEMVAKDYTALSVEESQALKARYDKLIKADRSAYDKRYQEELKAIQQNQRAEQNQINEAFFSRDITAQKHEEELIRIKVESLEAQLELAKKYNQDTTTIEQQLLAAKVEQYKVAYESIRKITEKNYLEEQIRLREQLENNEITQEEYDQRMLEAREEYYNEQQRLADGFNQDSSVFPLKLVEEEQKEEERLLKQQLGERQITQDQYDSLMIETRVKYLQKRLEIARSGGQDETAILQAILDAQVEAEDLALKQMQKLKEDAQDVMDSLYPKQALAREEDLELANLQKMYDAKLLTEEDFQKKKREIIKRFNKANLEEDLGNISSYVEQANVIFSEASNFVSALKEAESAQMEAEYQEQLTAAGDNAEKREQIETAYEQKKLDLTKRYADAEMAVNIAKTIASGAVAAIKAIADSGWIAGGIVAGLIAASTATEVATIVAQRNAIKNTSLNSSGSSTSTTGSTIETGTRTMTGYSGGGYTMHATSNLTPAGIVHANEWVAPEWLISENPVLFANLEEYRQTGIRPRFNDLAEGYADGGFTSQTTVAKNATVYGFTTDDIRQAVYEGINDAFIDRLIHAYVVYNDIEELREQTERLKRQTSRS